MSKDGMKELAEKIKDKMLEDSDCPFNDILTRDLSWTGSFTKKKKKKIIAWLELVYADVPAGYESDDDLKDAIEYLKKRWNL